MKKLFAILLVTVLTSCGAALEPPKSNTDYKNIIGKPIKIGNIEVAEYVFPKKMIWKDAKKACASLGPGWRLPTKDELNILYQNKDKVGGFASDSYWTSSGEFGAVSAWHQNFVYGLLLEFFEGKRPRFSVRAVRDV